MAKQDIALKSEEVKFLFKRSENRKAELRRLYDCLITKASGRVKVSGVHEKHHIIPRSLGGSDEPSNIAVLTFDEHFFAHYLLALITEGAGRYSMLFAMEQMAKVSKKTGSRRVTRRQYSLAKKAKYEASTRPEHGSKISAGLARRKEELGEEAWAARNKERGGKISEGCVRRREKLGKSNPGTARRKEKLDKLNRGHDRRKEELSEEARAVRYKERGAKISESRLKNSPAVRCLNDGREYDNAVAAAKVYNVESQKIHRICKGHRKSTRGYRFEYA